MLLETDAFARWRRSRRECGSYSAGQPPVRGRPAEPVMGRRRPHPGRAVQRRAAGGARAQPRRRPDGDARRGEGRLAGQTARRQRGRAARRLSRCRRGDRRRRGHHAGGRVADRQLPRGREADPRDPSRPATRLLSPAARSSPAGRSRAIRACSAWPGRSSPTPTACSTRRSCAATCAPIRRCSR